MFKKLFARRKHPSGTENQFPISLKAREWASLKALVESPDWVGFRAFLENYAALRAQKLLQPLTPDQTNIERGAIAAVFEVADLPEKLIAHFKETQNAKRNGDEPQDVSWFWGNSLFADQFRNNDRPR